MKTGDIIKYKDKEAEIIKVHPRGRNITIRLIDGLKTTGFATVMPCDVELIIKSSQDA